jgi:aldose 1-epimerase
VRLWSLSRETDLGPIAIRVAEYGATLQAVLVPDSAGVIRDVVLGHDSLADYITSDAYFGAVLGRFANRIRRGAVTIAGQAYHLPCNDGAHHLHGGPLGFDRQIWAGAAEDGALVFRRNSPAGETSYPGTLSVTVRYGLSPDARLEITMRAETDAPTLCNLAHHGYWNLAGTGSVLDHMLTSPAAFLLATDADLLPTGEVLAVQGTGCDFRAGRRIGQDFDAVSLRPNASRTAGVGYDHTLVLGSIEPDEIRLAARLLCRESGLGFDLCTDAPALQVYAGGDLGAHLTGKGGVPFVQAAGIALETQGFPYAPEFAHFPSATLYPDRDYLHRMEFQFFQRSVAPTRP